MADTVPTTNPDVTFRRLTPRTPLPKPVGKVVKTSPLTAELAALIKETKPMARGRTLSPVDRGMVAASRAEIARGEGEGIDDLIRRLEAEGRE